MPEAAADSRLFTIGPQGDVSPLRAARDFDPDSMVLAALAGEVYPLLAAALARHRLARTPDALTLLVPPRAPPELSMRMDGAVVAFLASGRWVLSLLEGERCPPAELCYRALCHVLGGRHAQISLDIVDTPDLPGDPPPAPTIAVDAMVPHRGSDDHLRVALAGLARQSHPCRTILCFDQPPPRALCRELETRADLALFEVVPSPAGPYVPRQHFLMTSAARYLAFQDSDDFSLPARVAALVAHAEAHEADLVGCHELRCDETTRRVEAIRYPLDVNRALRTASGAAQLFPTTVARVSALRRIGGFSTVRTFGGDKQFHLRAYRDARMLNKDAFLYVRRLRTGSLTTSPETGMQSPIRMQLMQSWQDDFARVKDGSLDLAESSLRIEHASTRFRIRDLRTGDVFPAKLRPDQ